jgi:uncharacterized SAM-binding protein YcdF (DUF218 family)
MGIGREQEQEHRVRRRDRSPADALMRAAGVASVTVVGLLLVALALLAAIARRAEREASAPTDALAAGVASPAPAAIVVFGATVYEHGPCGELRARLDHAAALWELGVAPAIVVSGGTTGELDETRVMRDYLRGRRVPDADIRVARPGDTTRETLRTLAQMGRGPYVLVSSPYHALRLRWEARRQGVEATVSAPASTPETRRPQTHRVRFASELVAVTWYALPPAWTARTSTRPGTARHVVPQVLSGKRPPRDLLALVRRESR